MRHRARRTSNVLAVLARMRLSVAVFVLFVALAVAGGLILRDTLLRNANASNTALSRYYAAETDSNLVTYEALLDFGTTSIEQRISTDHPRGSLEAWAET